MFKKNNTIVPTNSSSTKAKENILWLKDIGMDDLPLVGGKNASLGEMYNHLTEKGIQIPNGFVLTANAYWTFLRENKLEDKMKKALKGLDVTNIRALTAAGKKIRESILHAPFPKQIEEDILRAYTALSAETKQKNISIAVRSSATAEDLPEASFAGQQESYLHVQGKTMLLASVKKCIASLFTNRAISYRDAKGFDHMAIALSVTIQQMVRSDSATSGVLFTIDTESGFSGVSVVTASYGLGENIVKGRVTPDQFYVFKEGLKQGKSAIISRSLGTKEVKLIALPKGGTKQTTVLQADRDRFSLDDTDVLELTRWGTLIEDHYGKPQDIEWAKDGPTGKLFIVQARPETVKARGNHSVIESYELKQTSKIIARGIAVGQKIGAGKALVIDSPTHMKYFKKGEVLVTRITDPDWEPIMRLASAIITEQGGKTSHAAIVSRELGVPCIVGVANARKLIKTGAEVTASCAGGDEGVVYKGILPFEVKKTEIQSIPATKTKIMMNVGDPDHAFALSFLPQDGVGLARLEFIFTNFIRIHPLALVHYNTLKDKAAKKKIQELTRGYKKKTDYCIEKLAEGIGRIASAMYPKDVIIRLSDFKTNEYATLIGGKEFEPKEENPMLGWRGASRYYSKEYKEGFRLECEAIKKARDTWGLGNIIVMVPFCRTPEEGEKVLKTMAEFGLKQGENGLKVYVMCEIPSNVILAEEFAKLFDGFSIGSNDLTQLTLGVDRDSSLVHNVYDENNAAVKELISTVIRAAHLHKKKVGICGQAPSDYPAFAEFLVKQGIDSISLNPDTVMATRERIAFVEKTIGKTGNKTNVKLLSLVAGVAMLGALIIGLGAGCIPGSRQDTVSTTSFSDVSPALIREKLAVELSKKYENDLFAQKSTIEVVDFAEISFDYPSAWSVKHWGGGIVFKNDKTGEYMSVFRQILSDPIPTAQKTPMTFGNRPALQYEADSAGKKIVVYEIPVGEEVIEVNLFSTSTTDLVPFTVKGPGQKTIGITHWDIREKRVCEPILVYAAPKEGESCQPYMNPCDVPSGFTVCDGTL